ncbi:hypothetical protein OF83DRAFT_1124267 [Amylostereum chailletii]|nr:hypothetical protein OF83DRAFT_1124267 [Amylostereum chailletii]
MPSLVPLDNLLGAALVGVGVSTAIYGLTWLQVYLYYTEHSGRDGKFLKAFVAVLMVLDTTHVAFLFTFLYHYTVTNYGDLRVLAETTWSLIGQVTVGTVMSFMVQCFFARRVYILGKKKIVVPSIIVILSLGQLVVGGILYAIKAFQVVLFSNAPPDLPYALSALSMDLACDATIAVAMIYYLRKSRAAVSNTNRAIDILITYTMNTCLLTTICACACLILWVTSTRTLVYAPFFFVLVRLYSCSLMCSLNSRDLLREKIKGVGGVITLESIYAAHEIPGAQDNTGVSSSQTSDMTTRFGVDKGKTSELGF